MKRGGTETLQQKLDGLDSLSAGIVYGKEDAWDKLQARMEQKPARKIAWRYWAAAAAVLLLICATVFYKMPQEQEIVRALPVREEATKQNVPAAAEPQIMVVRSESPVVTQNKVIRKNTSMHRQPAVEPKTMTVVNAPAPKPVIPAATTQESALAATPIAAKQPMKVYHINDLEHGNRSEQSTPAVANTSTIDLSRLPVMNIQDLEQQDVFLRSLRRENRMSWERRFFSKPDPFYHSGDNTPATNEQTNPRNFLRELRNQ